MKKIIKYIKVLQSLLISLMFMCAVAFTSTANANINNSTKINEQDAIKLSQGLNLSTDDLVYDIGAKSYYIFDNAKLFQSNLFTNSQITDVRNISFTGRSKEELSKSYGKSRAINMERGITVPVPEIQEVSANIGMNFQTDISQSLTTVNEEYYEYFERYQQTRIITTDWKAYDLTDYFNPAFVEEFNKINNINDAIKFLEKYGTHVFDKYCLGGSLIITNYVVSSVNISEEYRSNNVELSLNATIAKAAESNAGGSAFQMEGINVSNENTKSMMNMRARGGMQLNALTVNDLFTYKQEYATGGGSGYVYVDWIKSFDKPTHEVVIDVANPVAIWELMEKSSYYNPAIEYLLQQAFEVMSYSNYATLCNEYNINSNIIGNIQYESNGVNVKFSISDDTIKLPSGTVASVELGETITRKEDSGDVIVQLNKEYDFARIEDNKLVIDDNTNGKSLVLEILMNEEIVYSLKIGIFDDPSSFYSNGYGTIDQPYLITTSSEWNSFINNRDTFNKRTYFALANDIDLNGENYSVGGGIDTFKGVFDGNNFTLSNFSVISKGEMKNIGIFSSNYGIIQNLTVENAKIINSGILEASNSSINAGVIVGENYGSIYNVIVKNSSIRISSQLKDSELNVGLITGLSAGQVVECGVTQCNVYGLSWKESGSVNVGGIAGNVRMSEILKCYVNNTKINALNEQGNNATYNLGGVAGNVVSASGFDNVASFLGITLNPISDGMKIDEITIGGTKKKVNADDTIMYLKKAFKWNGSSWDELGLICNIDYCITQDNTYNTTNGNFGYIVGNSNAKMVFSSCYFEGFIDKASGGSSAEGCKMLRELTLLNINEAAFNLNWTTDSNGNIILKKHA